MAEDDAAGLPFPTGMAFPPDGLLALHAASAMATRVAATTAQIFTTQPTRTHVHGPLIWKAYADDTSTVSDPSKLLLSAMLDVSVLFSVAK